jgi:putative transposase
VHLLRHSLSFASWKDRRELVAALRPVYTEVNAEVAREALEDFAAGPWGRNYPAVAPARQREQVIPFFAYPPAVRRIIYTTNAIESLNSKLRTAVRSRSHFPNDEAATKLVPGVAPGQPRVEDAATRMGRRQNAVRGPLRRPVHR